MRLEIRIGLVGALALNCANAFSECNLNELEGTWTVFYNDRHVASAHLEQDIANIKISISGMDKYKIETIGSEWQFVSKNITPRCVGDKNIIDAELRKGACIHDVSMQVSTDPKHRPDSGNINNQIMIYYGSGHKGTCADHEACHVGMGADDAHPGHSHADN